jgi:polyhydroxyalkanoate synthase
MTVGGGLADLRPTPRVLLDQGQNRSVSRLSLDGPAGAPIADSPTGPPVLLVPPLGVPTRCFDLRRGCSVAEYLLRQGHRTYLLDYGRMGFSDRWMGIEHFVRDVLPKAITVASEDAGGQPVRVVGWCLGGIFSVLTAADSADLPIDSVITVASPIDFRSIPLVAPLRPLVELADGWPFTGAYRAVGHVPSTAVRWAFQLTGIHKHLTKPLTVLSNLDNRELLAQIEAVERFTAEMVAFPGRTFGQIYHRLFRANDLADGTLRLSNGVISLADVRIPVLVISGDRDWIAPQRAVHRMVDVLTGSPEIRYEVCPGGHLGVLAGRAAQDSAWPHIDAFLQSRNAA